MQPWRIVHIVRKDLATVVSILAHLVNQGRRARLRPEPQWLTRLTSCIFSRGAKHNKFSLPISQGKERQFYAQRRPLLGLIENLNFATEGFATLRPKPQWLARLTTTLQEPLESGKLSVMLLDLSTSACEGRVARGQVHAFKAFIALTLNHKRC